MKLTIWNVYQTCGQPECQQQHKAPVRVVAQQRYTAAMLYFFEAMGRAPIVPLQILVPRERADEGTFDIVTASTPIIVEDSGELFDLEGEGSEVWEGLDRDDAAQVASFGFVLESFENRAEGSPVPIMAGVRTYEAVMHAAIHRGEDRN